MIDAIRLQNFKCFRDTQLSLGNLTLLSGLNSAGKSTVIQSFLIWDIARRQEAVVPLSGNLGLSLGDAQDVLHREAEDAVIKFTRSAGETEQIISFEVPDLEALHLRASDPRNQLANSMRLGSYLSAERLGPRDALEVSASASADDSVGVGHQGQYTAQVLAERERDVVPERRRFPSQETDGTPVPRTLASQAEAWLSAIVGPTQLLASKIAGTSLTSLRFKEPSVGADWLRPSNVGFGLSYALPVIVAGLTSDAETLLLVENPEAHLHPAGQSMIGEFLSRVAADGVQVIVETHSDHVLNGVRRAVAVEQILPHERLVILFFGREGIADIRVRGHGGLTDWPESFFDQLEADLAVISRQSRR